MATRRGEKRPTGTRGSSGAGEKAAAEGRPADSPPARGTGKRRSSAARAATAKGESARDREPRAGAVDPGGSTRAARRRGPGSAADEDPARGKRRGRRKVEAQLSTVALRLQERVRVAEERLDAMRHRYLLALDNAHRAAAKARDGGSAADRAAAARAREQLEKVRERRRELQGRTRELIGDLRRRVRAEAATARARGEPGEATVELREHFVREDDRRRAAAAARKARRKPARGR